MNNSGFFFCGVVVGLLLAGAYGIDFFRSDAPVANHFEDAERLEFVGPPAFATASGNGSEQAILDGTMPTEASERDATIETLTAELAEAGEQAERAERELERLREALGAADERAQRGISDAIVLRRALEELREQAAETTLRLEEDLSTSRARESRQSAALAVREEETYNLLERFFASKRTPQDAILVSGYFATSAPEKLKGQLVDVLVRKNPDVLAALSPTSASERFIAERPWDAASGYSIAPAAANERSARPTGAVQPSGGVGKP